MKRRVAPTLCGPLPKVVGARLPFESWRNAKDGPAINTIYASTISAVRILRPINTHRLKMTLAGGVVDHGIVNADDDARINFSMGKQIVKLVISIGFHVSLIAISRVIFFSLL